MRLHRRFQEQDDDQVGMRSSLACARCRCKPQGCMQASVGLQPCYAATAHGAQPLNRFQVLIASHRKRPPTPLPLIINSFFRIFTIRIRTRYFGYFSKCTLATFWPCFGYFEIYYSTSVQIIVLGPLTSAVSRNSLNTHISRF